MVIPGGKIIGGMGGHIWFDQFGTGLGDFVGLEGVAPGADTPDYIECRQWQLQREWLQAECTHSGTYGAITRRNVAFDWRVACSLPLDQANIPDTQLALVTGVDHPGGNVAIALYLGDVKINPEAVQMGMQQKFYYAPAGMIRHCQVVLDAAGDVIRTNLIIEGNSRMYLFPDESRLITTDGRSAIDAYLGYLADRGWTT